MIINDNKIKIDHSNHDFRKTNLITCEKLHFLFCAFQLSKKGGKKRGKQELRPLCRNVGSQAAATYFRPSIELNHKSHYSFFKKVTEVDTINHAKINFKTKFTDNNHISII